jgi:hypothetical protein
MGQTCRYVRLRPTPTYEAPRANLSILWGGIRQLHQKTHKSGPALD